MSKFAYKKRLYEVLSLARAGKLRNSTLTAKKLYCSKRTVKRLIARLRFEGHEICYDIRLARYRYGPQQE